jgi:predicted nucleic acid-binding protein
VTHSYVVVETVALAQRRLGAEAAREFLQELAPVVTTVWVDEPTHQAGVAALLAALPTNVSLVDFVSFEVMRERGISVVFGFDDDFVAAGFTMTK